MDDNRYASNGCFGILFAIALSIPIWAAIIIALVVIF